MKTQAGKLSMLHLLWKKTVKLPVQDCWHCQLKSINHRIRILMNLYFGLLAVRVPQI